MDIQSLLLSSTVLGGGIYTMHKIDKNLKLSSCFYDKLLIPVNNFINKKASEDILEVLAIHDNYIEINTQHQTLYAIELSGNDTIEQPLTKLTLDNLYEYASKSSRGYFYQAIFKDKNYQKQYIFSYSLDIIEIIAKTLDIQLLTGKEIVDVLFDLFLDNSFYIQDKQIHRQLNIGEDTTVSYQPIENKKTN